VSLKDGRFGKLEIVKKVTEDIFECTCDCGNLLHVWRSQLVSNVQRNCWMCCCPRWVQSHHQNNPGVGLLGHMRTFTHAVLTPFYVPVLTRVGCGVDRTWAGLRFAPSANRDVASRIQ